MAKIKQYNCKYYLKRRISLLHRNFLFILELYICLVHNFCNIDKRLPFMCRKMKGILFAYVYLSQSAVNLVSILCSEGGVRLSAYRFLEPVILTHPNTLHWKYPHTTRILKSYLPFDWICLNNLVRTFRSCCPMKLKHRILGSGEENNEILINEA